MDENTVGTHIESIPFTEEEFYIEVGWFLASTLTKELLDNGLISVLQYKEITELNKDSFPIISVDLLPKSLDTTDLQR
ncbi:SHOCT domain-containing protein [Anaerovibrio sp.]|uniref:SHOCT domain-containing protein n=1 Tax=Anaerovibrio sp. TaxID=1872532 RepID=UPI0025C27891|nr:SHOCT domain-containing protein [Anaerovibrio sp.]MBR2142216.1 hypothetical protein [Anaerovibrio sp.]